MLYFSALSWEQEVVEGIEEIETGISPFLKKFTFRGKHKISSCVASNLGSGF